MERQIVDYYEQYEAEPEVAALYQTVLDAVNAYMAAAVRDAFCKGFRCGRDADNVKDRSGI